ncbi:hypothetical protein PIB30_089037 [Stylosanthes scabra]|uniref:Glycosyltransferase n=1 Tax=Stylosanthes scabra TaxID=79078 RepID=A0ABU6RUA4_9FABA|nr:hypothetical protein [Stylosanthes scabra]
MAEIEKKKNSELIFIPSMGFGHLASALELANLLINHDTDHNTQLSVTVLCMKFSFSPYSDSYIKSVLSSQPKIKLIDLPQVEPPPQDLLNKSPTHYVCTFIESLKPHVKSTIQNILSSNPNRVLGLVLDFFCVSMIDVADQLGLPSYMYMTSNLGFLSFMLSLKNRQIEDVFTDSDPDLLALGISNPVPSSVLPDPAFNRDGGYSAYYRLAQGFTDTKGIIVNTFLELERYAFDALLDGNRGAPPMYCVGPLIEFEGHHQPNLDQSQYEKLLRFLDEQEASSVVFLCFGSKGRFGPSQTREIAIALQRSGVRFLWAMRLSLNKGNDNENALPEGFLEWMEGRGMICEWAPQVEILAHKAIGGFVSHCGWNSILESLWFGVPILTWPIYAEQQLNAFRMVKEFGLALELKLDYRTGSDVVMADEIEKGLKNLMNKDSIVHKKVQEMKEKARKTVINGGSSLNAVRQLISDMVGNN